MISAAEKYKYVDDLCIISTYYNPCNYKSKKENFDKFLYSLIDSELHFIIIESVFENEEFTLQKHKNIKRIRGKHLMWQKERLLNIALKFVPKKCSKIAWLDCDVLFENADWAVKTSTLLNCFNVIQPFEHAIRLPKNCLEYNHEGFIYEGFASIYKRFPNLLLKGDFGLHGHTGFCWASHKNYILKHGLYDCCISGSGDHMMAHAFCGDWDRDSRCIRRIFGDNKEYYFHFTSWAKSIYPLIRAKMTFVEGSVLHLWHGEIENRKYTDRNKLLENIGYCPTKDLKLGKNQCWEWRRTSFLIENDMKDYFFSRKEDEQ